ncbi:MAG: ATP synthase subunit C [Candidatus Bathyarchaeota archaeon]
MFRRRFLLIITGSLFLLFTLVAPGYCQQETSLGNGYIAMGIAMGMASLGAGYAVAKTGSAAIASLTEKPELFARVLIFTGLAEGIAIYGIIISLLIWITLPV